MIKGFFFSPNDKNSYKLIITKPMRIFCEKGSFWQRQEILMPFIAYKFNAHQTDVLFTIFIFTQFF